MHGQFRVNIIDEGLRNDILTAIKGYTREYADNLIRDALKGGLLADRLDLYLAKNPIDGLVKEALKSWRTTGFRDTVREVCVGMVREAVSAAVSDLRTQWESRLEEMVKPLVQREICRRLIDR